MFIHDAVLEQLTCGNTQIMTPDLNMALQKMNMKNKQTGRTGFAMSTSQTPFLFQSLRKGEVWGVLTWMGRFCGNKWFL